MHTLATFHCRPGQFAVAPWVTGHGKTSTTILTLCFGEFWVDRGEGLVQTCFIDEGQQGHALPGVLLAVQVNLEVDGVEVDDGRLLRIQMQK